MSALTAERSALASAIERPRDGVTVPQRQWAKSSPAAPKGADGEPTLDELLASVWERLAVHAAAECTLCGGPMEPLDGAQGSPAGGRCRDCGTALS